jgi:hypothetical protein
MKKYMSPCDYISFFKKLIDECLIELR